MKHYLTEDFDGNKVIVSLVDIRKISIHITYDDKAYLEFVYSDESVITFDVATKERANLLVEDIYRSLEEPKNDDTL